MVANRGIVHVFEEKMNDVNERRKKGRRENLIGGYLFQLGIRLFGKNKYKC